MLTKLRSHSKTSKVWKNTLLTRNLQRPIPMYYKLNRKLKRAKLTALIKSNSYLSRKPRSSLVWGSSSNLPMKDRWPARLLREISNKSSRVCQRRINRCSFWVWSTRLMSSTKLFLISSLSSSRCSLLRLRQLLSVSRKMETTFLRAISSITLISECLSKLMRVSCIQWLLILKRSTTRRSSNIWS